MIFKLSSYKGKFEIIIDEDSVDELDVICGEIDEEQITDDFLDGHVQESIYYGVPAYIGTDQKLNKRIERLYKKYE